MARRVLVISQHFPPSSEIAGKVTARLLRYLAPHGWEPTVLTVSESETGSPLDHDAYADVLGSIQVERVGRWPHLIDLARMLGAARSSVTNLGRRRRRPEGSGATESSGAPQTWMPAHPRLYEFLRFPDRQAGWIGPAVLHARRLMAREPFDAVMTVAPPHSTTLVGLALRRLVPSVPWIAQLHDPWVPLEHDAVFDPVLGQGHRLLEEACVKTADCVLCATHEIVEGYVARYPDLAHGKFGALPNGYDPRDFPAAAPSRASGKRPLHIVHLGTIYLKRDPRPLLRALAAMIAAGTIAESEVTVEFIGDLDGIAATQRAIDEIGLGRVATILGRVDHVEALRRMVAADVLLLLAQEQPFQIPAKLYEYMNAGRFVLAFTSGATARLVGETGAGRVVADGANDSEVVAALTELVGLHRAGRLSPWPIPEAKLEPYQVSHLGQELATRLDSVVRSHGLRAKSTTEPMTP